MNQKGQIKELLDCKAIEPANSSYCSPAFLVTKMPDSQGNEMYRFVSDFRQLNDKTVNDKYPLPSIANIIDYLLDAQYNLTFDLAYEFSPSAYDRRG